MPERAPIENDEKSDCFGCGPANERGLRLSFFREGDTVVSEHRVSSDETGWPSRLHGGLMFTVLSEVGYWTIIALRDRIGVAPALSFAVDRLPRVGSTFTARGRIVREGPEGWEVVSEAADERGVRFATLSATYRPVSREMAERAGFNAGMMEHVRASALEPIVIEQTYSAPIESVWRAITDQDQMRQWFFETIAEFQPERGFEMQFNVHAEGRDYLHLWKVTEVIPMKRIVYDWKYGGLPGASVVAWDLSEAAKGTRLELTHAGGGRASLRMIPPSVGRAAVRDGGTSSAIA